MTPGSPGQIFDDVARALGAGISRRGALALAAKGFVAALLAEVGVRSAWAQQTCLCQGQVYDPRTTCCTPSGRQQKHPITNLNGCPSRVPHPGYTPGPPNGCGAQGGVITPLIPNHWGHADFLSCCNPHDTCYGTCLSSKGGCDSAFGSCLDAACTSAYQNHFFTQILLPNCYAAAGAYHAAVSLGGGGAYTAAQSGACDCCGTSTCPQSCAGSACGSLPACDPGGDCVCFTSTEGTGACVHGATPCSSVPRCTTTADCPSGYACLTTSCCGSFGVCGPLCNPLGPAQSVSRVLRSQSGVPTLGGL
ncbi:MAG TPA: hypothetical protein VFR81_06345 [Longimicrobium sp.]|nr:hypothetical protein [Longimicrobium sp.]